MNRLLLAIAALALPSSATAATRTAGISSFDRIRIDGSFDVRIATGRSATATLAGDGRALDAVELRVDGSTLTLRRANTGWGERGSADPSRPVTVTLTTPSLTSASMIGAGRLVISRMKGERVDLTLSGPGAIDLTAVEAQQLTATVIGAGSIAAGGRATRARLTANGAATINAAALEAGDLVVNMVGSGEVRGRARFTAQVTNTGLGQVTVEGSPKCTVSNPAGGSVRCGVLR